MYIDRIDLSLAETQIQAVLEALGSAAETIQLLPSVSLSDRKRLAKLGLKNEALALQIIEVGRLHPDLITRGIDFEKIDRDRVAREQLLRLKIVLEALLGKVNDSMLLTGVDLYAAALSIYHSLRRNAGTTSLRDTVNELKKGFARPSRKKKEKQDEVAASPSQPSIPPQTSEPTANVSQARRSFSAAKTAGTPPEEVSADSAGATLENSPSALRTSVPFVHRGSAETVVLYVDSYHPALLLTDGFVSASLAYIPPRSLSVSESGNQIRTTAGTTHENFSD